MEFGEIVDFLTHGKLRLIAVEEANADTGVTLDLRPAAGKKWLVLSAYAHHDDIGASRNASWQFYDGTTTMDYGAVAISTTDKLGFTNFAATVKVAYSPQLLGFLVLNRDVYMQCKIVFATGQTYKLYIKAVVLELPV